MAHYFGVSCATCDTKIALAKVEKDTGRQITFYVVPLDPVPCRSCGSSHMYGSEDGIQFEGPEGLLDLA